MYLFGLKWRLYLVVTMAILCCLQIESSQQTIKRTNVRSLQEMTLIDSHVSNGREELPTVTIDEYIKSMYGEREQMLLLQWNASGFLERMSTPKTRIGWIEPFLSTSLQRTSPSEHGKLAFVFVSDIIIYVRWDLRLPIPMMIYTLRNDHVGADNYYLVPNPYDLSGFSQRGVDIIIEKSGGENVTFETFSQRQSRVMWRGGYHYEKVREDLVAFSKKEEESAANGDTLWLDAKFSFGPDEHAIKEEDLAASYKYHLDVGGVSGTSWEGLRWKMCSGNLVFRIDTYSVDWWHYRILPGVHYLPVKEDFSNLREQFDWAEKNPLEAYEIAQRGQKECLETYHAADADKIMREMVDALPAATFEQMQQAEVVFAAQNDERSEAEEHKM